MGLEAFRTALASKLGQTITPELAVWLEANAMDYADLSHDPAKFQPEEYSGLTFRVERLRDIWQELHVLHGLHFAETERYRRGTQMLPDYDGMRSNERAGRLVQFTARDRTGRLVGNARMYVYRDSHAQELWAKEDTFYLLPEARKGFRAIRFWQYLERGLAEQVGVSDVITDTKIPRDEEGNPLPEAKSVGRLNEYLGYQKVAEVWHKRLKPAKENTYVQQ